MNTTEERTRVFEMPVYSVWRHYKGDLYLIVGFTRIEETTELAVSYVNFKTPSRIPWSRPISQWQQKVLPPAGGENASEITRFVRISNEEATFWLEEGKEKL